MSFYNIETWTIRDVAKAFAFKGEGSDPTDLKVVIPIFQRGLRWEAKRRREFIDSLEKGYPFGSLLFAKQEGINKYSVVDGLQRGSTVHDYVNNPLAADNITEIDEKTLVAIRDALFPDSGSTAILKNIEKTILEYLHEQKQFNKVNILNLSKELMSTFPNNQDKFELAEKIHAAMEPFLNSRQTRYNNICGAPVPIVVYSGPQELLSEIFNRINTKGIPLNDYEIYAATWSQKKYTVNNQEIVQKVVNKYLTLVSGGYAIEGFSSDEMLASKQLTAFEFLFGLGKYWTERFDCLKVESKKRDDEINEIGFEIIDACLNNSKSIASLDKLLQAFNLNKLQRRVEEAIRYVSDSIAIISSFKGNKRKYNVLHSKYQIISLISYTFREMYNINDLDSKKPEWGAESSSFHKKLLSHYVADIITSEWHDGGAGKVYSAIREQKYDEPITRKRWDTLLDGYYQNQLQNKQNERFSNPVNADSVILNCVYVNLFTAGDQLSTKKFDIEHLATKERMRLILGTFGDLKLPVSCIANLCYLPEDINRGKKEKTIYEAGTLSLPISEIEEKFSFTQKTDFEWITYPYTIEDRNKLVTSYQAYLDARYAKIKEKFLALFV